MIISSFFKKWENCLPGRWENYLPDYWEITLPQHWEKYLTFTTTREFVRELEKILAERGQKKKITELIKKLKQE